MRILWLSHRDIQHPRAGGAERTIYEVSRRLVALGEEVVWASCNFPGSPSRAVIDGVHVFRTGSYVTSHLKVGSLIQECLPDVIVDDMGHVVPWLSELLGGRPGTVFFRHLHSRTLPGQVSPPIAWTLSWVESVYPRLYRRWPFVTESEQGIRDLEGLGIPRSRIVRIPPGVDLEWFHPRSKFIEPTMIYFGGFRDYKRPWVPVSIYEKLRERIPALRLLMIGDGPSRGHVEGRVPRSSNSQIQFLGRLDDTQLAEALSRAWLNVHASVAEGWGLSIIEAAAAGTPTVAFAVPGVSETIEPGVNGLTVPDGEVDALADAATRVLSSVNEWGIRSRRFAESFTWELATDRWRRHLRRVVDESKGFRALWNGPGGPGRQ